MLSLSHYSVFPLYLICPIFPFYPICSFWASILSFLSVASGLLYPFFLSALIFHICPIYSFTPYLSFPSVYLSRCLSYSISIHLSLPAPICLSHHLFISYFLVTHVNIHIYIYIINPFSYPTLAAVGWTNTNMYSATGPQWY